MTFNEFQVLDPTRQGQALQEGTFLECRYDHGYVVALYAVHNFFVEAYYSHTLNEIFQLKPFKSIHELEPYLPVINTRDLL
jgi:hypothetical protein